MAPLLLSHMTSADFWRKVYPTDKVPAEPNCTVPRESLTCSAEETWCIAPSWITPGFLSDENGIVHLTVCDRNDRRKSSSHICHLWKNDFPGGSFYRLSDEVYVASPAFTFLQLAQELSLAQLVAYGNEICGLYSFDSAHERGLRQRDAALTTVEKLRSYVDNARGFRGQVKAAKAVAMIAPNSASPLETTVEMLQCLPYRYGGYGLPIPTMNCKVQLSDEAASIARRSYVKADICWPANKIDLEFHGEHDHASTQALHSDRARTNALSLMNYRVIEITSHELFDLGAFEAITREIGDLLGKRVAKEYRGALPQRVALRQTLFDWNRASGRRQA